MKVLYIATVTGHITAFHLPYLKWFKEQGWEVHVATFGDDEIPYCDVKHSIEIRRSPFKLHNIKAYFQLKSILKNQKFDIIHGHTPMGGILARLCGKKHRKTGTKIMYTAHGFHFYKGAPFLNWLLYYPIEKRLSKYTDALITMNKEDFALANRKMKAKKIYHIPGIGIDTSRFASFKTDMVSKRNELGIPHDSTVIISIGELSKRKNHQTAIKCISKINSDNLYYVICGQGELENKLLRLCRKLEVDNRVLFLGYRSDTADLLHMSDIFLFTSLQEGLPVALMEAMAAGLPCVVSRIRGNADLIEHSKGGFLCGVNDVVEYKNAIEKAIENREMGSVNQDIVKKYDIKIVMECMKKIYNEALV